LKNNGYAYNHGHPQLPPGQNAKTGSGGGGDDDLLGRGDVALNSDSDSNDLGAA
jgi:hypothetical protein